jgi:hypothetical protein
MESVRLICASTPFVGEEWRLKRTRRGLVLLDEEDEVFTKIPAGEASTRIQFPSFFASRSHLVIVADHGLLMWFEPRPRAIERVNAMIEDCIGMDPSGTAASFRSKAIRDLLIGTGSFLVGVMLTCAGFFFAAPDGKFLVMTGFIVVGLVEIVRGIYFAIKAIQVGGAVLEEDYDDGVDEDDDNE